MMIEHIIAGTGNFSRTTDFISPDTREEFKKFGITTGRVIYPIINGEFIAEVIGTEESATIFIKKGYSSIFLNICCFDGRYALTLLTPFLVRKLARNSENIFYSQIKRNEFEVPYSWNWIISLHQVSSDAATKVMEQTLDSLIAIYDALFTARNKVVTLSGD